MQQIFKINAQKYSLSCCLKCVICLRACVRACVRYPLGPLSHDVRARRPEVQVEDDHTV